MSANTWDDPRGKRERRRARKLLRRRLNAEAIKATREAIEEATCPRCDVWCGVWDHSYPDRWCAFCGMNPLHEGPAAPPVEIRGLADLISESGTIVGYGSLNGWRR